MKSLTIQIRCRDIEEKERIEKKKKKVKEKRGFRHADNYEKALDILIAGL